VARAHLVGMSFGAGIAQSLALDHPARVASLTLASATPGGPGHAQADLPGWVPSLFENEPQVPDWSDRDAVIDYLVEVERPYSPAFDEAAVRSLAARVFDHAPDLEQRLTGGSEFDLGAPWRERLGEIDAPTLVIHGADDPLFPLAHGQALADEIPGARLLVLEPCGHEYFPPATWDVVVPAILRVSGG
jgi:pimeloyl-ACP methyl ester carboxylesterase